MRGDNNAAARLCVSEITRRALCLSEEHPLSTLRQRAQHKITPPTASAIGGASYYFEMNET